MNRTLDYRTDLYSLGIVFYEMLTGRVPFESDDPLGVIYSHIARKAVPPVELDSNIPKPISDIVMKLVSKTAEDRYQNGFGLRFDLQKCFDQLDHNGDIKPFKLGQRDISVKFHIPEKLVGETMKPVCSCQPLIGQAKATRRSCLSQDTRASARQH